MAEKKPVMQKCKVLRAFYLDGEIMKPKAIVELEEPFAIEMKASLKVEFVGEGKQDNPAQKDDDKK